MGGGPGLPELQTFLLGFGRRGDTTVEFLLALGVSRHQLLKQSHVGTLFWRHIVNMCQIGIKGRIEAVIAEESGKQEEDNGEEFLVDFRGMRNEK